MPIFSLISPVTQYQPLEQHHQLYATFQSTCHKDAFMALNSVLPYAGRNLVPFGYAFSSPPKAGQFYVKKRRIEF